MLGEAAWEDEGRRRVQTTSREGAVLLDVGQPFSEAQREDVARWLRLRRELESSENPDAPCGPTWAEVELWMEEALTKRGDSIWDLDSEKVRRAAVRALAGQLLREAETERALTLRTGDLAGYYARGFRPYDQAGKTWTLREWAASGSKSTLAQAIKAERGRLAGRDSVQLILPGEEGEGDLPTPGTEIRRLTEATQWEWRLVAEISGFESDPVDDGYLTEAEYLGILGEAAIGERPLWDLEIMIGGADSGVMLQVRYDDGAIEALVESCGDVSLASASITMSGAEGESLLNVAQEAVVNEDGTYAVSAVLWCRLAPGGPQGVGADEREQAVGPAMIVARATTEDGRTVEGKQLFDPTASLGRLGRFSKAVKTTQPLKRWHSVVARMRLWRWVSDQGNQSSVAVAQLLEDAVHTGWLTANQSSLLGGDSNTLGFMKDVACRRDAVTANDTFGPQKATQYAIYNLTAMIDLRSKRNEAHFSRLLNHVTAPGRAGCNVGLASVRARNSEVVDVQRLVDGVASAYIGASLAAQACDEGSRQTVTLSKEESARFFQLTGAAEEMRLEAMRLTSDRQLIVDVMRLERICSWNEALASVDLVPRAVHEGKYDYWVVRVKSAAELQRFIFSLESVSQRVAMLDSASTSAWMRLWGDLQHLDSEERLLDALTRVRIPSAGMDRLAGSTDIARRNRAGLVAAIRSGPPPLLLRRWFLRLKDSERKYTYEAMNVRTILDSLAGSR